jgi:hypothetical protein
MGVYNKTTWVNDGGPKLNAANLQKIENQLASISNDYGIGTVAKNLGNGVDFNTVWEGGFYRLGTSPLNSPTADNYWYLHAMAESSSVVRQFAYRTNPAGRMFTRILASGVWSEWAIMWNSANDGNGGRAPFAKPISRTAFNVIGEMGIQASSTTPNISGAVFCVIAYNSSGQIVGADGQVGANIDVTAYWPSTTGMVCWRTV